MKPDDTRSRRHRVALAMAAGSAAFAGLLWLVARPAEPAPSALPAVEQLWAGGTAPVPTRPVIDHAEVDWSRIPAAPNMAPLAVAAYDE